MSRLQWEQANKAKQIQLLELIAARIFGAISLRPLRSIRVRWIVMEHLEGRQSVFAALEAFQRRFEVILMRHGIHKETVAEILELAERRGVPVRYVESAELDAMAHGATHGGVLAIASAKPR